MQSNNSSNRSFFTGTINLAEAYVPFASVDGSTTLTAEQIQSFLDYIYNNLTVTNSTTGDTYVLGDFESFIGTQEVGSIDATGYFPVLDKNGVIAQDAQGNALSFYTTVAAGDSIYNNAVLYISFGSSDVIPTYSVVAPVFDATVPMESESASTSESTSSESASLSNSTSLSDSTSTSTSVSDSTSTSVSDSTSASLSDSTSTSVSDSASTSTSVSDSTSTSVSDSASTSVSDSASASTSVSDSTSTSTSVSDSTSTSTSVSDSASTSTSISDSTSASTSVSDSTSTSTSVSDSTSTSVSDSTSTSVSDSTSTSVSDSTSTSTSVSDSASTSTSVSDSTSTSVSDSTSASTSVSDSTSASTSVSDSTSTSVSDSTSASTSVSDSTSTSTSVSDSASTSTSVSDSKSTSTSVSDSTSASTSLSDSTSTSTSVSDSTSTSTSVSDSTSASTSVSDSASTSTSISDSTSASTSVSDSTSTSTSVSDSTSTSTSLSDSTSTSVSENIVISTAVDQPEYVVVGNIVPQDEHGNPVGPEIPYGPVKPGTTVDTPYGDVEVPGNGGDVVIQIKTPAVDVPEAQGSAVDVPEYVVAGNIVPQDEHGNPVGPEIPYGPVKPGTTVGTPYGDVEVPGNGGDIIIQVKVAVDQPEYVLVGNIVPEDENGNSVGPKIPYGPLEPNPEIITPRGPETPGIVINTPYGPVEVPVNGGDIIITVATEVPGIAVYEKTAVDQPEYVVVGNVVPQDENGNPVGPEIPYGPVAPETTIDTPYGDVEVPANGGDITIQVKAAVDQPEYVVVGNIVPENESGNPVGPEIPYGPVTPGTMIDTPYGSVIVPDAGGDVVIVVKVETNKTSPISDIKGNPTTTQEVVLPVASSNNDGQPVNIDHSENTDKQLPKTSVSQNNDHVVISGLILTTLLGLLALLKRKNNN